MTYASDQLSAGALNSTGPSQIAAKAAFSARGIELALDWQAGTPDRPKRASESDFDSGVCF